MKKRVWLDLFLVFCKIGTFTIGGGYAMVPLIQEALVDKKKWLTEEEFIDSLVVAQSTPGPLAVNTGIITGYRIDGVLGMIFATLGAVLPSFVIILALATVLSGVRDQKLFIDFFNGVKPVAVALIFISVIKMGRNSHITLKAAIIPLIIGLIVAYTTISPIVIIILTFILGNIYYKKKDEKKKKNRKNEVDK